MTPRLDYWAAAPELMQSVFALHTTIENCGLDRGLVHLVKLRASQINGCAYCIELHTREARKDGESETRLHLVSAWRDSFLYEPAEAAALRWTEALTHLADHSEIDAAYAALAAHFSAEEQVKLTSVITMINTWNRYSVAFRARHGEPEEVAAA